MRQNNLKIVTKVYTTDDLKGETILGRKVANVLRHYTPNKHKHSEIYAHHILMLFYPLTSERNRFKEISVIRFET